MLLLVFVLLRCCIMNYNRRRKIGPSDTNQLFCLVAMQQALSAHWPLLRAIVLHCQGTRAFFKIHVAYEQQLSFSLSLIVLQTLTLSISLYKHKKRNPSFMCSPSYIHFIPWSFNPNSLLWHHIFLWLHSSQHSKGLFCNKSRNSIILSPFQAFWNRSCWIMEIYVDILYFMVYYCCIILHLFLLPTSILNDA